jgi:hypothetical protein
MEPILSKGNACRPGRTGWRVHDRPPARQNTSEGTSRGILECRAMDRDVVRDQNRHSLHLWRECPGILVRQPLPWFLLPVFE